MKRLTRIAALALCVLLLAGCGRQPQRPSGDPSPEGNTQQPEKTPFALLQEEITQKNCLLGVGLFGYVDSESDEAAIREFASGSALAKAYPFLMDGSPVLAEGAELYAFVPANGETAVTICPAEISEEGSYIDHKDAPLYTGRPGEAVVLRCNLSEICANVLVSVTDGKSTLEFHPMISLENGHVAPVQSCWDFSVYEADPVETARELLLAADAVQDAVGRGMQLIYTGDTADIDGCTCPIFALGTDHEEQFVREQLCAVANGQIYTYSVLSDSWQVLGAE